MALTAEQQAKRENVIGSSFVANLMLGKEEKIYDEWLRLIGSPDWKYDEEDVWLGYYGSAMESIMLDWRERKTGHKITCRGEQVIHPLYPYLAATLDGVSLSEKIAIEAKTVNMWMPLDDMLDKYRWQSIFQSSCLGYQTGAIYLSHGGMEPKEYEVPCDPILEVAMLERLEWFWNCVETMTSPVAVAGIAPPVAPDKLRTVEMSKNNAWTVYAADWLANKEPAKKFDIACDELKKLMQPDVGLAKGSGIQLKRTKAGFKITELKP